MIISINRLEYSSRQELRKESSRQLDKQVDLDVIFIDAWTFFNFSKGEHEKFHFNAKTILEGERFHDLQAITEIARRIFSERLPCLPFFAGQEFLIEPEQILDRFAKVLSPNILPLSKEIRSKIRQICHNYPIDHSFSDLVKSISIRLAQDYALEHSQSLPNYGFYSPQEVRVECLDVLVERVLKNRKYHCRPRMVNPGYHKVAFFLRKRLEKKYNEIIQYLIRRQIEEGRFPVEVYSLSVIKNCIDLFSWPSEGRSILFFPENSENLDVSSKSIEDLKEPFVDEEDWDFDPDNFLI